MNFFKAINLTQTLARNLSFKRNIWKNFVTYLFVVVHLPIPKIQLVWFGNDLSPTFII